MTYKKTIETYFWTKELGVSQKGRSFEPTESSESFVVLKLCIQAYLVNMSVREVISNIPINIVTQS